jgi:cell division protein FtsW
MFYFIPFPIYPKENPVALNNLVSIGSGSLFGTGVGNSILKDNFYMYGPENFVFSIMAEQFGFVGSLIVLSAFFGFCYVWIKIIKKTSDCFVAYLTIGLGSLIVLPAFFHIGSATLFLPTLKIHIPFISYAYFQMLFSFIVIGILMSIIRVEHLEESEEQKPFTKKYFWLSLSIYIIFICFVLRLGYLQIIKHQELISLAKNLEF